MSNCKYDTSSPVAQWKEEAEETWDGERHEMSLSYDVMTLFHVARFHFVVQHTTSVCERGIALIRGIVQCICTAHSWTH